MAKKETKLHFAKVERFNHALANFNEKLHGHYVMDRDWETLLLLQNVI